MTEASVDRWSGAQVYAALVQIRNTELAAHWTRYNIQAVLNLGVLVATLNAQSKSRLSEEAGLVAIAGLLLAINWIYLIYRSKQLLTQMWEKELRRFEKDHLGKPKADTASEGSGWTLFSEDRLPPRSWESFWIVLKQPLTPSAMAGPIICLVAWAWIAVKS